MREQRPGTHRGWIFMIIILILLWHKPILKIYFILDYGEKITSYSRAQGVNPALISAIVFVESRFNAEAESHKGALGLMQIMPSTGGWVAEKLRWKKFKAHDLLDPDKNLQVGAWYLAYLRNHFNQNDYLALASYNAGTRYVQDWLAQGIWDGDSVKLEQIPFPETKKYIIKVIILKKIYHYLYPELLS